ncbi:MAG TPA: hypothetical protein ENK36_00200 [Desulfobacterales bacterium]|nr:hypothetical protein [Desulfobacterales bacterium]
MPDTYKRHLLVTLLIAALMLPIVSSTAIQAYEGIETYYIRYDVKSSRNKITGDDLLMIPAKNDFRAENFSQISTTGVISAAQGKSKKSIEKQIRDNALKSILVKNGLKSVKTKDYDTVISYEGVIITPLNILKNNYNEEQNNFIYEVQVEFTPIAFPDQWETLNMKHKIKEIFYNFFQLFK